MSGLKLRTPQARTVSLLSLAVVVLGLAACFAGCSASPSSTSRDVARYEPTTPAPHQDIMRYPANWPDPGTLANTGSGVNQFANPPRNAAGSPVADQKMTAD